MHKKTDHRNKNLRKSRAAANSPHFQQEGIRSEMPPPLNLSSEPIEMKVNEEDKEKALQKKKNATAFADDDASNASPNLPNSGGNGNFLATLQRKYNTQKSNESSGKSTEGPQENFLVALQRKQKEEQKEKAIQQKAADQAKSFADDSTPTAPPSDNGDNSGNSSKNSTPYQFKNSIHDLNNRTVQKKAIPRYDFKNSIHNTAPTVQKKAIPRYDFRNSAHNKVAPTVQKKVTPYQFYGSVHDKNAIQKKDANSTGNNGGLPADVQSKMETSLGEDFSNVNIHKESQQAKDVGALAYAQGNDVHFAPGQFKPESQAGQELIGHELTHVKQQREGRVKPTTQAKGLPVNDDQGLEKEADDLGKKAANGEIASNNTTNKIEGDSPIQGKSPLQKRIDEGAGTATESPTTESPATDDFDPNAPSDIVPVATGPPPPPKKKEKKKALEEEAPIVEEKAEKKKMAAKQEKLAEQKEAVKGEKAALKKDGAAPSGGKAVVSPNGSVQLPPLAGTGTPKSTEEDPAFGTEKTKVETKADEQKTHEPTEKKVKDAQDAAKAPANEKQSLAEDKQVEKMEATKPGEFDAYKFKEDLRGRIAALTPKNLTEVQNFEGSGKAEALNTAVSSGVETEKKNASNEMDKDNKKVPDTSAVVGKEEVPLPEAAADPELGAVDPSNAAPKKKDNSLIETPIQDDSKALDDQMATAEITEEQLMDSNEPEFMTAVDNKKEAQTSAESTPAAYRQAESGVMNQAQTEAQSSSEQGLSELLESRVSQFQEVATKQDESISEDELKRQEVADNINSIFTTAQTSVRTILDGMTTTVNTRFQAGADTARAKFETYVDDEMSAYKSRRYSGVIGKGRWVKDKFMGMPNDVNRFYERGRDRFVEDMDVLIDEIATYVGQQLAAAKKVIKEGRKKVATYVKGLDEGLQDIGEQCLQDVNDRFDQLEEEVQSSRDQLIDNLAQSYTENLSDLDARIEELQAANRGLVDKAIDAVKSVIETIIKLKDMLLNVIKSAAGVIGEIIKHPIKFLSSLIQGAKQGFNNFVGNISTHLQGGLTGWLLGTMSEMGITPPAQLDLKGIIGFAGDLLGMSWNFVRGKITNVIGEENMERIEASIEIVKKIKTEGVSGIVEEAREKISDIKNTVMDSIKTFLVERVFKAGVMWILSMLNPASAFVKACMAIYDIVMFFINRAAQIKELIDAILGSMAAIVAGNVSALATAIESTMARMLPVAISFLASLLGLGGIAKKVKEIMKKVRGKIEQAIDWVVEKIKKLARKLGLLKKKGEDGKEEDGEDADGEDARTKEEKQKDLDAAMTEVKAIDNNPATTKLTLDKALPTIKSKYRLKRLEAVPVKGKEKEYKIYFEVNPTGELNFDIDQDANGTPDGATEPVKKYEAKSHNGNNHLYCDDSIGKRWYWREDKKVWHPLADQKKLLQAEKDATTWLENNNSLFESLVKDDKLLNEPGFDNGGIQKDADNNDQYVIGETKGAFGNSDLWFQHHNKKSKRSNHFSATTDNLTVNIDDQIGELTDNYEFDKIKKIENAIRSGNIEIIYLLAGKARISKKTLSNVKREISKKLIAYVQKDPYNLTLEDARSIVKNVNVKTQNI